MAIRARRCTAKSSMSTLFRMAVKHKITYTLAEDSDLALMIGAPEFECVSRLSVSLEAMWFEAGGKPD